MCINLHLTVALAIALTVALAACARALPDIVTPLLTVPQTATPPTIDGRPNDGAWKSAAFISGLQRCPDAEPAAERAHIWVTYDQHYLYLAFTCFEPEVPRDDIAEDWRQHERVVIEWRPANATSFDLGFDTSGGERSQPHAPPPWWDDRCRLAVHFDQASWSAEVAIAFASLGVGAPGPGDTWGFNLRRIERKRQEDTSVWCQRWLGDNWTPERMGDLRFGGPDPCTCSIISLGERSPGRNLLEVEISNRGRDPAKLLAATCVDEGGAEKAPIHLESGETRREQIPYHLADGGGQMVFLLGDADGTLICRQGLSLALPRNAAALQALAVELPRLAHQAPAAARLQERRHSLGKHLAAARSRADWLSLAAEIEALELDASKWAYRLALPDPHAPYALAAESPLRKIFRHRPLEPTLRQEVELWACRNEREAAQVVILPFDAALRDVAVEAADLVGPRGRIARDQIEITRVGYVQTHRTRYRQDYVGWHPDPLMPLAPFDVPRDSLQPIWLTVSVPADAPAGRYRGEVRVAPANAPALTIPVTLHVWDFTLPRRPALRTAMALFEDQISAFYGWSGPLPQDLRRRHYDFFLRRRISPGCMYSPFPIPRLEDLDYCIERGANAITLGYLQADPDAQFAAMKPYLDHLRAKGWLDLAYIYGFDEVTPPGFPAVASAFARVAKVAPGVKRAVTLGAVADLAALAGSVDIFIPQTDRYRPEHFKPRRQAGAETWVYLSMWPRHPHANAFIDYPALDRRIVFWQCWQQGISGFNYYACNLWQTNCTAEPDRQGDSRVHPDPRAREAIRAGKRWPEVPWNTYAGDGAIAGDGHLVYPGPNGELLSSIRLECISDGIEDYDYLALLRGLTDQVRAQDQSGEHADAIRRAEELLAVNSALAAGFDRFTPDPEVLLRERRRVAEQILELQGLP